MTNETKHTPTPWNMVEKAWSMEGFVSIIETEKELIANVFSSEDAAHIVKCVNMHDELVEAIQDLICAGDFRRGCEDLKSARETLKKAGAL